MSEKELIGLWKNLAEQKFNLPSSGSWKQRDFEYLSELIFEKTETRLSVSTLKRIWKDLDNRMPQVYTLNVLANLLGYNSWTDFKLAHLHQAQKPQQETKTNKGFLYHVKAKYVIGFAILLLILSFFIFYRPAKSINEADIVFKSRKNLASGVPNTVVFEYDISKINFDSAFIQQSWDVRMRAGISGNNHYQTFIYYYPGYHTARLIIDGKVVKKDFVNITTSGWDGLVDGASPDGLPKYIAKEDIVSHDKMYVSKEVLLKNDIRIDDKTFWVNYFNVGNFKEAKSEDFVLETRIKNDLKEGALVCQYTQLTLICESGMISIPFCNPGCTSNIHLHISDVLNQGKKSDLSPFGTDLSDWRNIKVRGNKKTVTVFIDNKNAGTIQYTNSLGRITGLHYKFYGCGAVDTIALYNQNKTIYSNGFKDGQATLH